MAGPNTLVNTPLNEKDRLELHIIEFLKDSKYLKSDPRILSLKKKLGFTANYFADAGTINHFLGVYARKAVKPLRGGEWILSHPKHYLNKDKTINYILVHSKLRLHGKSVLGFWHGNDRNYAMQITDLGKPSDLLQGIRLPIHELGHSHMIGTESENDFLNFDRSDWFNTTGKYKTASLLEIVKDVRSFSTTPGMGKLYDAYVTDAEAYIKSGKSTWFQENGAVVKEAYVAYKVIEEIYSRAVADVAVSNSMHNDMDYIFKVGHTELLLSKRFIKIIKKGAWPRIAENKPGLFDLFKGKSLWD